MKTYLLPKKEIFVSSAHKWYFGSLLLCLFCTSAGLGAQCWPEGFTHNTRPDQMWLSCETTASPNPLRGQSLWLQFDLGYPYALASSTIWNYNEPTLLELGVTRLAVDYSLDGQTWIAWGEIDLSPASGRRDYEGEAGPDFGGESMRYVLFTVLSTGNGQGGCAGLSEVRFDIDATVAVEEPALANSLEVFPNPAEDVVDVRLNRPIRELEVYDQQGRLLLRQQADGSRQLQLDLSQLPAAVYQLRLVDMEDQLYRRKLVLL